MPETSGPSVRLWRTSRSIALELDVALAAVNGFYAPAGLPPELRSVVDAAAEDWQGTWGGILIGPGRSVDLLEIATSLAGTFFEEDYSRATMAVREMTAEAALERLQPGTPKGGEPVEAQLVELALRQKIALYKELSFPQAGTTQRAHVYAAELAQVVRLLRGGDLHARFWHWLDRFYYELYGPWRKSREAVMVQAEQRLRMVQTGGGPGLAVLPAQSPLLRQPELRAAYEAGKLEVVCWLEPFGLADTWALYRPPSASGAMTLVMSCAEPGQIYENFLEAAADIASRANALADPTRLVILRLIRHFGMVNTEIAEYLGLARPTVSVHAKILRDAGLIRSRQEGRVVRHELVSEEVRRLFQDLEHILDLPDEP